MRWDDRDGSVKRLTIEMVVSFWRSGRMLSVAPPGL